MSQTPEETPVPAGSKPAAEKPNMEFPQLPEMSSAERREKMIKVAAFIAVVVALTAGYNAFDVMVLRPNRPVFWQPIPVQEFEETRAGRLRYAIVIGTPEDVNSVSVNNVLKSPEFLRVFREMKLPAGSILISRENEAAVEFVRKEKFQKLPALFIKYFPDQEPVALSLAGETPTSFTEKLTALMNKKLADSQEKEKSNE